MFRRQVVIVITVTILSLFISCVENQQQSPFGELQLQNVESSVLLDDQVIFPLKTVREGDKLYVTDRSNKPSVWIFRIDEANDLHLFKELGREGRGGGEFLAPDQIFPQSDGSGKFVYDAGGRKLVGINNQFEIESNEYSFRSSGMPTNIHSISEDRFLITGILPESRFEIYEKKDFELIKSESFGEMTSLGDQFGNLHLASAWRSQSVYHSGLERIALFSSYAERIELYAVDGELLHTVSSDENGVPKVSYVGSEFVFENDAIISYVSATSDENYIYALYSGKNYGDEGAGNGTILHVFDWALNFIEGFQLDHHSVSISADNDGKIYSTQNHPESAIKLIELNLAD